jgi:hypothetical protein
MVFHVWGLFPRFTKCILAIKKVRQKIRIALQLSLNDIPFPRHFLLMSTNGGGSVVVIVRRDWEVASSSTAQNGLVKLQTLKCMLLLIVSLLEHGI